MTVPLPYPVGWQEAELTPCRASEHQLGAWHLSKWHLHIAVGTALLPPAAGRLPVFSQGAAGEQGVPVLEVFLWLRKWGPGEESCGRGAAGNEPLSPHQ